MIMLCYITHDMFLYNTRYVMLYNTFIMLCYITHDMYMLYNTCYVR